MHVPLNDTEAKRNDFHLLLALEKSKMIRSVIIYLGENLQYNKEQFKS